MTGGLTPSGLARLRSAAERHARDDRVPETSDTPEVHRDIQAAAYAALG